MNRSAKESRARRIFQKENARELKYLADQVREKRLERNPPENPPPEANPLLQRKALQEKLNLVRREAQHRRNLESLKKFLHEEQERRDRIKLLRQELKRDRALEEILRSGPESQFQQSISIFDPPLSESPKKPEHQEKS